MRWRTVPASPRGPGGGNTARRGLQLAWEGTQSEAAVPLRATGIRAGSVPVPGSGLPGNIRAGRVGCEGIGPVREGDASEYAACADEDEAGGFGSLGFVVSGSRGQFRTFETEIPVVAPWGAPSSSSVTVPIAPRFPDRCRSVPGSDVGDRRGFLLGTRAVRTRVRSLGWFRFTLEHSPFHWVAFSFSTRVRSPFRGPWEPTVLVSNHVADVVDFLAGVGPASHGRWKRGGYHRKNQTCKGIPSHLPSKR